MSRRFGGAYRDFDHENFRVPVDNENSCVLFDIEKKWKLKKGFVHAEFKTKISSKAIQKPIEKKFVLNKYGTYRESGVFLG